MGLVRTFLQHFTYLALVAVLMAAGMGVPIPEDFPLIFSGYLCHEEVAPIDQIPNLIDTDGDAIPDAPAAERPKHVPNLYLMIFSGMVGVLAGDSIVFFIGRRGIDLDNFVARHLRKVLHSRWRQKVERHFHRHGNLTVFVARFMPGCRSLVFVMAGMSRMTYVRYILIDGCAALISVPTFILLGYRFARHINELIRMIDRAKGILLPIVVGLVATVAVLYYLRHRRLRAALHPTDVV